jgi:hypothetical protein
MPQITAQPAHGGLGSQGPSEAPVGRPALPPLAIEAIGLRAAGDTLGLAGSQQEPLQPPSRSQGNQGHPVAPGGFQGARGDATGEAPIGQGVKSGSAGAETAYGVGGAPRGHGAPGLRFADGDAGGVGVADLEGFSE